MFLKIIPYPLTRSTEKLCSEHSLLWLSICEYSLWVIDWLTKLNLFLFGDGYGIINSLVEHS